MGKMYILVVDDDPEILSFLRRGLIYEGYEVDTAADGPSALVSAREKMPDFIILDVMLPGLDGFEVCRRLRRAGDVPILMLTAKDAVPDKVTGLDSGADDYLVKPFAFDELLARMRALLRRSQPSAGEVLHFSDLVLDTATRQVERAKTPIELSAKEFELLEFFIRHPRQVLSRDQIYENVWGYDFEGESNIIEVYMSYLRNKTEAGGRSRLIHTVRGAGYVLRE